MLDKILSTGLDLEYFTLNNWYSPKAKHPAGCVLNARKFFYKMVNIGYLRKIENEEKPRNRKNEEFYQVTFKGAKARDLETEYKRIKDFKSVYNIKHESMKIDVCMAFKRLYGDDVYITYTKKAGNKLPDAYIRFGRYEFFIEIERKREPNRVIKDTILKYDTNKFPKVLVVYAPIRYPCFLRPIEYTPELIQEARDDLVKLIKKAKENKVSDRFRFMHFMDFYRLNEAVWFKATGEKCKIINQ